MAPPITIIGTGISPDDLTARQIRIIENADILVGGQRLIAPFAHLTCRKRIIDKDLKGLGDFLAQQMTAHTIVVLASGDPLFFGIGAFLARRLGAANIRVLPNVSAVACAFARLGEPWQDVRIISLHGRSHTGELLRHLADGETVAVYTDPAHDPAWLAAQLVDNGLSDVDLWVLEELGSPMEKITHLTPAAARQAAFSDLNLVVLKPDPARRQRPALFPGMPEDMFVHEKGLITKAEVRAVVLSRLRLFDRAVLWDLGAGSGSVSIEAGQFIRRGSIYAVEQHARRVAQIRENQHRFAIGNLTVVEARLPDGLAELPDPDRVFIGGGGKNLADILRIAADRLKPGGIIVVNTVLIDTLGAARQTLADLGFAVDMLQLQVNQAKPMPYSYRFEAANPVWIVTGHRPQ
ncbi:Precorrin-6y C5,15-methyltransferase (Decarboxylating), CbiE subunit [Desulfosarcina cetonica]|uniref:precorrin-6y C5,15-methyltransferase (decarboxylating) subunit CbiE n=1 Tax=Desulfosarcina cetonica TaxID=90730 RepID=UPI0006CF948D|nr:precorrin-6y C5,15-methyltransferase (decarboxylating) subunit CbiE [Desulfosarcina cetonica]VTR65846.1 Precorrin-6y C5,15-methyltransferase (Decarboxylating), CbiE subunit [Desulfosarcina cetonica]